MFPPADIDPKVSPESLKFGRGTGLTKPCRACMDFKSWAKLQSKKISTSQVSTTNNSANKEPSSDKGCPLDKSELGTATWGLLHTIAAYYSEKPSNEEKKNMNLFINSFSKLYPCEICAEDFRNQIAKNPPQLENQEKLSKWFCDMHNEVNIKLGKPIFDCSKVNERWRDGWLDGSCD